MGLDNLTQVVEKVELMMSMIESGVPLSERLFDASAWSAVLTQLSQPAMLDIK